jgi:hypothetical protein
VQPGRARPVARAGARACPRDAGTRQGSAPVTDIALALSGLRGAAAERLLLARAEADAIFARGSPDAPAPADCTHEDGEEVGFSGFVQAPSPASRPTWTRLVPPPVLTGHASSLPPY